MKRWLTYIGLFLLFSGCNSENAGDCFQIAGTIIQEEISVADFSTIEVGEGVTLYLSEGTENQVILETGSNLINDVNVSVENGKLLLKDDNSCNFVRKYGVTKVYVTAVNITKIINNSQFDVYSEEVLHFNALELISEDYNTAGLAVGSFHLEIENQNLTVNFNKISNAYISGSTNRLTVNFYSGDSRFEGEDLIAQQVYIYHRSSNDMIVNPVQSISAEIVSTGDVIAVNTPEEIEVESPYVGQLIFTD
ncbi:Putative auto-transporter adhesin, head GIN domain [Pustulibacterium marinum]|uniref:Putative auto-transporter adhesin, head GIN domain n=1 Tax=Pustulibacterium marinum TaxID=1224947 RepID=A0A1I7GP74_9FLAO|nr:head GIN domain-containing protein [Pustulibacterium marinum]SFU50036.1 Putative auto-transporter adhesin, head GIN domain [Pustulibacterium marinum]